MKNTPSYLPHQGGGFSPLLTFDRVQPTDLHLPLYGGGREGATGATILGSPK